jgi:hypothetical protein
MEQRSDQRLRTVARMLDTAYARDRVAAALYEALIDGLRLDAPEASGDDREWLRGAIAVPLQDATEAAIGRLSWDITLTLEQAPAGVIERVEHGRRWTGLVSGGVT